MTLVELDEKRRRNTNATSGLQMVCLADVEPVPINWLWPERIARGKLTLISGDPGLVLDSPWLGRRGTVPRR